MSLRREPKLPLVVYIASAPRSGSTLLDMSLGSMVNAFNVGEMRRLREFAMGDDKATVDPDNRLTCTCGKPVQDCVFWRQVETRTGFMLSRVQFSSRGRRWVRRLLEIVYFISGSAGVRVWARIFPQLAAELAVGKRCFAVYDAIGCLTEAKVIIDSSKMIYHYLLLKTVAPSRVKLICLVRDGRAVANSMIKGKRKNGLTIGHGTHFERAIRVWLRVNLLMLLFFARTPPRDRLFLRYEDFCENFDGKVTGIVEKFRLPAAPKEWKGKSEILHNIGGSPSRFGFKEGRIALDDSWKRVISLAGERQFEGLGAWLNKRFGYHD